MEFKKYLFDSIEKPLENLADLNKNGMGNISTIFGGKVSQRIKCLDCKSVSISNVGDINSSF